MFLFILLQIRMPDGAGLYAETQINAFIKEPWNAYSSLTFLLPVLYWAYKLRGRYSNYMFLTACMPLLFLGGLGSTLFHAFRNSRFLLLLDVLPILLLFIAITIYFWVKVLPNKLHLTALLVVYGLVSFFIMQFFAPPVSININYFWRGVGFFLPALLLLKSIDYKGTFTILATLFWFVLALVFRSIDREPFVLEFMAMGSHWLWHISATVGAFYLAEFLYNLPTWEREAREKGIGEVTF